VQPIHQLLARIRWDSRFGRARFAIGYYDRVERAILIVPLAEVRFPPGQHGVFEVYDPEGALHRIPFHRVRAVYRDDRLIWTRGVPG